MNTLNWLSRLLHRTPRLVPLLFLGLALTWLSGCDAKHKVTNDEKCDTALDDGDWDRAIAICGSIKSDSGYSRTAQAYMGRAGISLLALIDKIGNTKLEGLALILGAFTVTPVQSLDVDAAIDFLLKIKTVTDTDSFNLIVSSDVAIATLLKDSLGISVDSATGAITIPGITDTGLTDLTTSSAPSAIQDVMDAIYAGTYYSSVPPLWNDPNDAALDLKKISSFIQANALGASAIKLGDLASLDFSAAIDNGQCALSSGQSASGVKNNADGKKATKAFPRRLNTSDSTAVYFLDNLYFVLLDGTGAVDSDREWKGNFVLPSRLLNPDFIGVECGQSPAGPRLGEFGKCMQASAILSTGITAVTESDLTTPVTCGGACTNWPLPASDGNPVTDDYLTDGTAARTQLAAVLHQLYPVDNDDTSPSSSGLHCEAGDGWVHAREFDYYLRNFGQ